MSPAIWQACSAIRESLQTAGRAGDPLDLCFGAVCKSCVFGYLPQSFPVKLPVVFIQVQYRAFQLGGFGYHVPGISCLDAGYAKREG